MDIQEMAVWTILSWRFLRLEQIEEKYDQMTCDLPRPSRMLETCLNRLEVRGLIARGVGESDFEALYDLLGELYVVPLSESLPLRLTTFGKLLLEGVPFSKAKQLFRRDRPNEQEARVMALSRQALLSTAELIKCSEAGATDISTEEKLMNVLIDMIIPAATASPLRCFRRSSGYPSPSPWPACICANRSFLSGSKDSFL